MRVLVVNPGSSSLKLSLLGPGDEVQDHRDVERWDGSAATAVEALEGMGPADAAGVRVVHGGTDLVQPCRIDDLALKRIEDLSPLAPLHQPRSVAAVRAVRTAFADLPAVACFDTAFHSTIPPEAATYAVPREWTQRWDLRRYGFHGLSHQYVARRVAEWLGPVPRLVVCHLGAGASLCAVRDGRSVDTTMGFTPLEGLVMATRSGSVDPGLVLWLVTEARMPAEEVADGLARSAGLAGLSGTSGDLREVLERVAAGDEAASLAFEVYLHRLRREVAAMVASLGGIDVLAYTGGVGERASVVRAAVGEGLGFLGLALDEARNASTTWDGEITAVGAPVRTFVVTAREDLEIASQVRRVLA